MRISVVRSGVFFLDGRPLRTGDQLELQIRPETQGGPYRWLPVTYETGFAQTPRVILPLQQRRIAIPAGGLELRWPEKSKKGAP